MNHLKGRIILFLLLAVQGLAAQRLAFRTYDKNSGLGTNEVYCVMEDSKGYMWIGTDHGLSRFDGTEFQNFTKGDGLTDTHVFSLMEDRKGRIWTATYNGRPCYYFEGQFYSAENDSLLAKIRTNGFISAMLETEDGSIWMSSRHGPIIKITPDGTVKHLEEEGVETRYWYRVYHFRVVGGHTLVGAAANAIVKIDLRTDSMSWANRDDDIRFHQRGYVMESGTVLLDDGEELNYHSWPDFSRQVYQNFPEHDYMAIGKEIPGKGLFLGFGDGLRWIKTGDPDSGEMKHFLKNKLVTGIEPDRAGNLWVTTGGEGLLFLSARAWETRLWGPQEGLARDYSNGIEYDSLGHLWVGYLEGLFDILKGDTVVPQVLKYKDPWMGGDLITDFCFNRNGQDFIVMRSFIYRKEGDKWKFLLRMPLRGTLFGNQSVALATPRAGLSLDYEAFPKEGHITPDYLKENSFQFRSTTAVGGQPEGPIFFGSYEGLFKVEGDTVIPWHPEYPELTEGIQRMLYRDPGQLWMTIKGIGVGKLENGKLRLFTEKDGLSAVQFGGLKEGPEGDIWVTTSEGLNRIYQLREKPGEWEVQAFKKVDGLASDYLTGITFHGDQIAIGGDEGITLTKRSALLKPLSNPLIHLKSIALDGKDTLLPQGFELPPSRKKLEVFVTGIEYHYPEDLRYEYVLEGPDTTRVMTRYPSITLTNLPAGRYRLKVWALAGNNRRSEQPVQMTFKVLLPFWKSWVFLTFVGLAFVGLVGGLVTLIVYRIRKQAQVKIRLAEAEQKVLRMQMNPHFIFNTLNGIRGVYATGDFKAANLAMSQFSELLRDVLELGNEEQISLEKELESLEAYLKLNQMRYRDKLAYSICVEEEIRTGLAGIPPLIIQPLVENAILHGILPSGRAGAINIRITKEKNILYCEVRDNGIGRVAAATKPKMPGSTSMGLEIVRQRLAWFNRNCQNPGLVITDLYDDTGKPEGTSVLMALCLTFLRPS